METKHTKTPWMISRRVGDSSVVIIPKSKEGATNSWILAECSQQSNDIQNAEYIVNCVNSHAELLAAARAVSLYDLTARLGAMAVLSDNPVMDAHIAGMRADIEAIQQQAQQAIKNAEAKEEDK